MAGFTRFDVLRVAFGFFAIYLTVMIFAMLSPRAFNLVMGLGAHSL